MTTVKQICNDLILDTTANDDDQYAVFACRLCIVLVLEILILNVQQCHEWHCT